MAVDLPDEESALRDDIRALLKNYDTSRKNLIPILQMIQEEHAYLPALAMEIVAGHLRLPASEVYGVATFYNQFRFHPPGRNPIKVCLGTACHVRGGDIILENFERKLEIHEGETSEDREFSLDRVACVGCCALAPVALMGETLHGHMAPSKVEGLILQANMAREKRESEEKKQTDDTE